MCVYEVCEASPIIEPLIIMVCVPTLALICPPGSLPKHQLAALVQRCLPAISGHAMRYLAMMVDITLPMHVSVTIQVGGGGAGVSATIQVWCV